MSDQIQCFAVYPTLAVPDVAATCAWYVDRLGFSLRFFWGTPPTHGALLFGSACIHVRQGEPQLNENWLYFDIDNLEAMHARACKTDVEITRPPETFPWGMREFNARDLNGYHLRFGQHMW
ncbi:MAG: VOC family protein [Pseudomonadota bacterium]